MTPFQPRDRVHLKGHAHAPATTGTVEDVTPFRVYVRWGDGPAITPHDYETLEPAGEPMSTTFKSAIHDHLSLQIERLSHGEIAVGIRDGNRIAKGLTVGSIDAPAIALAILEAAGHDADIDDASSLVNSAMGRLAMHVATEATKAKETADREALEAEAWTLYAKTRPATTLAKGFDDVPAVAQDQWLSIARVARELHGVTK